MYCNCEEPVYTDVETDGRCRRCGGDIDYTKQKPKADQVEIRALIKRAGFVGDGVIPKAE